MATIRLSGFREFQAKLKSMPRHVLEEVDFEVEDAAQSWAHRAKDQAPKDQSGIAGGISTAKVAGGWEVVSNADYSAYLEWGTRSKVRVPAGLRAYAAQFRGPTGQKGAREMIFEWCKRQGIDPSLWYIIYVSIMTQGISPKPFFFVQRPLVERELISNLKKVLSSPR